MELRSLTQKKGLDSQYTQLVGYVKTIERAIMNQARTIRWPMMVRWDQLILLKQNKLVII
ncbi:MAG: hypothetical protein A6F72_02505 [Cycloclasticus sp. symbiont of Poecilosclerida sp. N]|nr:MAG: hypothetical protein A6F72_02505 [Cycloclasticus sp. symbiont of Poecilosclerida sp. N]